MSAALKAGEGQQGAPGRRPIQVGVAFVRSGLAIEQRPWREVASEDRRCCGRCAPDVVVGEGDRELAPGSVACQCEGARRGTVRRGIPEGHMAHPLEVRHEAPVGVGLRIRGAQRGDQEVEGSLEFRAGGRPELRRGEERAQGRLDVALARGERARDRLDGPRGWLVIDEADAKLARDELRRAQVRSHDR